MFKDDDKCLAKACVLLTAINTYGVFSSSSTFISIFMLFEGLLKTKYLILWWISKQGETKEDIFQQNNFNVVTFFMKLFTKLTTTEKNQENWKQTMKFEESWKEIQQQTNSVIREENVSFFFEIICSSQTQMLFKRNFALHWIRIRLRKTRFTKPSRLQFIMNLSTFSPMVFKHKFKAKSNFVKYELPSQRRCWQIGWEWKQIFLVVWRL